MELFIRIFGHKRVGILSIYKRIDRMLLIFEHPHSLPFLFLMLLLSLWAYQEGESQDLTCFCPNDCSGYVFATYRHVSVLALLQLRFWPNTSRKRVHTEPKFAGSWRTFCRSLTMSLVKNRPYGRKQRLPQQISTVLGSPALLLTCTFRHNCSPASSYSNYASLPRSGWFSTTRFF